MASPSSSTPKSSNTVTHGIDKSASKKKQVGSNYAWLLVPALLALLVSGTIHYVITLKEQANTLDEVSFFSLFVLKLTTGKFCPQKSHSKYDSASAC